MTPGGFVRIVDRIKDVTKTGGEWVSPIVRTLLSDYVWNKIKDILARQGGRSPANGCGQLLVPRGSAEV